MVNLIPELALIIGEQPPVPELPPQDAQSRFQLVFRRFLGVFARPEHPLALFLDDLQWLDTATLELLERLVTEPDVRHLLLVGAYRDNEVSPAHPLMRTLGAIRNTGARVQEIVLAPARAGRCGRARGRRPALPDAERAQPLAELVFEKTERQPVLRDPVHRRAGGRGVARVRPRRALAGGGTWIGSGPSASPTTWSTSWRES